MSAAGRLCKQENPEGYTNVLLHMKRHIDVFQAMNAMQAAPQQPQQGPQQAGPPQGPNGNTSPNQNPNPAGDNQRARPMAAPLPRKNNATIQ